ncbi:MAG: 50S ribosomal protein L10 [Berryella intestinalis]|uniref:Large ribosomal subunit protein uL10 n=1 Tax=Berryella intestinalis TaxID=1531429 RepID=A0A0A8BBV6_9ACTN|nr:50S ribosomal protein L10 [Berryella intestinalis]AJC12617.1 50S ribosomal protein L10 [Berryella intestinalis]MDD7369670.1 50S ribosomal protein L10 [Berryella intestinalis]MDY3129648.1 50S ribosomal protein L10 [Berryella intestinalis]
MPNAQNQAMMASIKEDLADVKAVWVVDYRGLSVKEVEGLRRDIREADASMKVYKNTLVRIALKELDMANLDEVLEGPSAFVFCKNDPVASAKALTEFAKGNDKLVIKGGMMDGDFVNAGQFDAVASLPSREQLLAQIAGAISGVARGLAVSINGVPSGLARTIQQVSEQKPAA